MFKFRLFNLEARTLKNKVGANDADPLNNMTT